MTLLTICLPGIKYRNEITGMKIKRKSAAEIIMKGILVLMMYLIINYIATHLPDFIRSLKKH